ncbi:histone H1-delta-like [Mizuhopecten yessoensis]|nr:histone H1-delta-like [Mizuhopecten yessoensis]
MSDAAAATAPAPAKKATKAKKPAKPKVPLPHPSFADMVIKAITALKERKGSSRKAMIKYIMANYKVGTDENKVNTRVKTALKSGVAKGALKQVKGTGASGSFKVGEKVKATKPKKPAAKKAAVKKPKKPVAAKAKKPAAKKAKKPAAKKPAAKKAAKPAAKKPKASKPKSPKKAKKPAAKKPAAKKAAKK